MNRRLTLSIAAVVIATALALLLPLEMRFTKGIQVVAEVSTPQPEVRIEIEQVLLQKGTFLVFFKALDTEGNFVSGIRSQDLKVTMAGYEILDFSMTLFTEKYLISWPVPVEVERRVEETSPAARATATKPSAATSTPIATPPPAIITEGKRPGGGLFLSYPTLLLFIAIAFALGFLMARWRYRRELATEEAPEIKEEEAPEIREEEVQTFSIPLAYWVVALKAVATCRQESRRVKIDDILTSLIALGIPDRDMAARLWHFLVADDWIAGNAFPTKKADWIPALVKHLEQEL